MRGVVVAVLQRWIVMDESRSEEDSFSPPTEYLQEEVEYCCGYRRRRGRAEKEEEAVESGRAGVVMTCSNIG